MFTVNFEVTDVPSPIASSRLSIKDLKPLPQAELTAALQRHFLYVCDVLRHSGVPGENLIASLLGSAIQEYMDNAMVGELERARKADPEFPATLTVLGNFMRSQSKMMVRYGMPAGLLGISMMNAGALLAKSEMGADKVVEALEGTIEAIEA